MTSAVRDLINYRLQHSAELRNDAALLIEQQRWKSAVNRLYYSLFETVSALMIKH
jgi:uncharacterized protein